LIDPEGKSFLARWRQDRQEPVWRQRIRKWAGWLGLSIEPEPNRILDHWALVEGKSGTFVDRGLGSALAVSTDARYLVAGNDNDSLTRVRQPGHKSLK
jgi:hypothetical protein